MKRVLIAPPVLPPAALADLKAWLGISTSRDDAELAALLATALDLCESFTGVVPIAAGCEEVLAARGDWQALATRPVQAITGLSALAPDGTRTALAIDAYAIDLDADGGGRVRLARPVETSRIVVAFTAGLAADWAGLPDALRHGVLRLAAHQHRLRDQPAAMPPAAIAALWRPWRRMRLT